MKAEDIERIYSEACREDPYRASTLIKCTPAYQAVMAAFARACEQHGVERAKQLVDLDVWKDLDAEIEKENET